MELEVEQRPRFTLFKGICLGVFLGLVFLFGPIYVATMAYTRAVMQFLPLVTFAGVFLIPIEVERITGSQFKRSYKLAVVITWVVLTLLSLLVAAPILALFFSLFLAVVFTISYCVGAAFVGSMEQDVEKKRRRSKYRSIIALLLVGCAATEGIIRFRDERIMLRESARITKHLGISLPSDLRWSYEFGSATSYISAFEHPSMPPYSRMIGTSDDVTVKIWFRSNRMQDLYINTSIKRPKFISDKDVFRVLRTCPIIKNMKLNHWPVYPDEDTAIADNGRSSLSFRYIPRKYRSVYLRYSPLETKAGYLKQDKVFPYGRGSSIWLSDNGDLAVTLRRSEGY